MKSYPRKQIMAKTQKFAEGGKVNSAVTTKDRASPGMAAQINPGGLTPQEIDERVGNHVQRATDAYMKKDYETENRESRTSRLLARAAGAESARDFVRRLPGGSVKKRN